MPEPVAAKILAHKSLDWCHLCGERKQGHASISYAENAESGLRPGHKYVRICHACAVEIHNVALKEKIEANEEAAEREGTPLIERVKQYNYELFHQYTAAAGMLKLALARLLQTLKTEAGG